MPSLSTMPTVPVSAMAKLAPEMASGVSRKALAQIAARSGGEIGRFVRQPALVELLLEQGTDLGAVAVDGRHQDVRRPVMSELHDHVGKIGLDGLDAVGCQIRVEVDFIRRHRLDLDRPPGAMPKCYLEDDFARLGRVARPMHGAAGRSDRRLQLQKMRVQLSHRRRLDRRPCVAKLLPVRQFAGDARGARPDRRGRLAYVSPKLRVTQRLVCEGGKIGCHEKFEVITGSLRYRRGFRRNAWPARQRARATGRRRYASGRSCRLR